MMNSGCQNCKNIFQPHLQWHRTHLHLNTFSFFFHKFSIDILNTKKVSSWQPIDLFLVIRYSSLIDGLSVSLIWNHYRVPTWLATVSNFLWLPTLIYDVTVNFTCIWWQVLSSFFYLSHCFKFFITEFCDHFKSPRLFSSQFLGTEISIHPVHPWSTYPSIIYHLLCHYVHLSPLMWKRLIHQLSTWLSLLPEIKELNVHHSHGFSFINCF